LPASLSGVVIDRILKELNIKGNISTPLKQCTACADDNLITARSKQAIIDTIS
jgi:hypothetical protein